MKLLVCGGRTFNKTKQMYDKLDEIAKEQEIKVLIQGGANGADTLAHQWALERCIPSLTVPANWTRDGKAAGPIRNKKMLTYKPDLVVAFAGGPGTNNMVLQAKEYGFKVIEV